MVDSNNYKLENIARKEQKLARIQRDILSLDAEQALDTLLQSNQPATLIQSFSDQDIHFLMHHIGAEDFLPLLAFATSEQWEYLLDVEVWNNDRIYLPRVTRLFDILFKADSQRLMRWLIKEKPEFIEYYFFKNIDVRIREHDEDPSDFGDGYTTIDNVFYIKSHDRRDYHNKEGKSDKESGFGKVLYESSDSEKNENQEMEEMEEMEDMDAIDHIQKTSEELIMKMLNLVAEMDLSVFQAVLMESCSVIPSEVEEEEFRLKNVRLAEKGFLPFYEAVGIYQPAEPEDIRPRTGKYLKKSIYSSDLPLPPQYPSSMLLNETLFAKSLSLIDDNDILLNLQMEFASLVNLLISADRKKIHHKGELEKVVQKACSYLSLGIEVLHGKTYAEPENGAAVIGKYRLEDIFRTGSGTGFKLKAKAKKWYAKSLLSAKSLSLSFLGEEWVGIVGGLLLDKPLYFDNYKAGVLYRDFASISDIERTAGELTEIIEIDRIVQILDPDIDLSLYGRLSYTIIILTMWARNRLSLAALMEPVAGEDFKRFFKELFHGDEKGKIDAVKREDLFLWLSEEYGLDQVRLTKKLDSFFNRLFDELEDEYGTVQSEEIDVNIVSHFFLKE